MMGVMVPVRDSAHHEAVMSVRELQLLRVLPAGTAAPAQTDRASVRIYRPFFLAAIFCVLTVGCLLGAVALHGIGQSESYISSAWSPYILAHANSQLFGWVGFFVMGFALQQHAPTIARSGLFHRLAWASLLLMAAGIALRFVAEPLSTGYADFWVPMGVAACGLQAASVAAFIFNMGFTRHRTGAKAGWQTWFVFTSLFWLVVAGFAEPFVFWFTHQQDRLESIMFVARWYPALREAQFLGFVAMMIFGVSLVKLNSCFGAREPNAVYGRTAFVMWTTGLLLRLSGWLIAFDREFAPGSQSLHVLGGAVLTYAAVLLVLASRIFEPLSESFRSHKFVRGAFAWLLISGALLIYEPLHLKLIGAPFSHAYTGAVRHAVTVGFISQMILGFGAHVVARMNDLDERKLAGLWSVFILLNIGNAARVILEITTDFTTRAFMPMGVTGFIELVALVIWACHVAHPMLVRRQAVHAE